MNILKKLRIFNENPASILIIFFLKTFQIMQI